MALLAGTGQWMASIGLEPGLLMALLAGGAEFFGGIALILGLLTRPAALVNALTMLVAILAVHIGHGLFVADGGYEFALSLPATVALTIQGGGRFVRQDSAFRHWVTKDGSPGPTERGEFRAEAGPLYGAEHIHELYTRADPKISGPATVPVLWDRHHHTIVNNESADIVRMLNSAFLGGTDAGPDSYPEAAGP